MILHPPNGYCFVSGYAYPPQECPTCKLEAGKPESVAKSYLSCVWAWWRCKACETVWSIRWHVNKPSQIIVTNVTAKRKKKPERTPAKLYDIADGVVHEKPKQVPQRLTEEERAKLYAQPWFLKD